VEGRTDVIAALQTSQQRHDRCRRLKKRSRPCRLHNRGSTHAGDWRRGCGKGVGEMERDWRGL